MTERGGYAGWYEQRSLLLLESSRPLSTTLSELGPGSHVVQIEAITSHGWDFEFLASSRGKKRWLWASSYGARHALCDAAGVPFSRGTDRLIGCEVGLQTSWDDGPEHRRATTGEYLAVRGSALVAVATTREELPPERTMRWRPFPVRRAPEPTTPVSVPARRHTHQGYKKELRWPSIPRTSG